VLLEAAETFEATGDVELAAEARVLLALGGYLIGREDDLEGAARACDGARRGKASDAREGVRC
jgi:hypothetical protein